MQLISWQIARLGSRFSLFFDPHHHHVMHSALGRMLDQPMDLMVGLREPDGTERALPFSHRGKAFHNPEQFERVNSITFRGYSQSYGLRFEFNVHSVFYPQDDALCIMPAIYLEVRVNPADKLRTVEPDQVPRQVTLFLRINRLDTDIRTATEDGKAHIDLRYKTTIPGLAEPVNVAERIISLNPHAQAETDGRGLTLELPVTGIGSGVKWRLVWGAFCGDNILAAATGDPGSAGRFRYTRYYDNLDAVMADAVAHRDDRLSHSRRFEKVIEQAPIRMGQRHLLNQSFQSFLASTFWCDAQEPDGQTREWFSNWASSGQPDPSLEVEYHTALFYLAVWPDLLAQQFSRWVQRERGHEESGGGYLYHPDSSPVEENAHFLLLLQAYTRWTGDLSFICRHCDLIERLAAFERWTDRQDCAFPTDGDRAETQEELALPRQTAKAIKRIAGLAAAADLLSRVDRQSVADDLDALVQRNANMIEQAAWLGDHYAHSVDRPMPSEMGFYVDGDADLQRDRNAQRDAYSINTAGALLLPMMVGHPPMLNHDRLVGDILGAIRETIGPYGCAECSTEKDNILISHNIWRDHLARYMGMAGPTFTQNYWDLQALHNTGEQALGYTDTYVNETRSFSPRGVASFGYLLTFPRLVIDRLAPGGERISVDPDRNHTQRWPLLPLADWKAGKIPVCVVDSKGKVTIENDLAGVFIRGEQSEDAVIG
jgi:hypothetical protein